MTSYETRLDSETTSRCKERAGRRRLIRAILGEAPAPLSLADLAHDIVRRESGVRTDETNWEAVQRCEIALYHVLVPEMVDAGTIAFDPDRRVVAGGR